MANNYNQHIVILGHESAGTRAFAEELLSSEPQNDIRYTLVHPNAAQILLRLEGIHYLEAKHNTTEFDDLLKTADGIMCLTPLEEGIGEGLIQQCEAAGVKRVIFNTREANYHPPASRAEAEIHHVIRLLLKSNLDWTVLRCSTIWGGKDDPFKAYTRKLKRHKKKNVFVGRKTAQCFLQPLHERDVAKGFIRAFDKPQTFRQTYTLSGFKPIKVEFILRHLCENEGKVLRVLPVWGRQRVLPKWLLLARRLQPLNIANLRRSLISTHQKAFRDFNFSALTPVDFIKKDPDNA